jgi:hypothetical protein
MEMKDSISSFNISSLPASSMHSGDLLGIQAEATRRSSPEDKAKKSVRFGDITIREHPMIIGDSVPGCGVPVTIDWEAQSEVVLKMEDYEECRPERRHGGPAMYMPPKLRLLLAMDSGRTMKDIRIIVLECERIRNERTRSLPSRNWSRIIKKVMRTTCTFKKKVTPSVLPTVPLVWKPSYGNLVA